MAEFKDFLLFWKDHVIQGPKRAQGQDRITVIAIESTAATAINTARTTADRSDPIDADQEAKTLF